MDRVRGFLGWLNREVLRPITLSVHVYAVRMECEADYGFGLVALLKEILGTSVEIAVSPEAVAIVRPTSAVGDTLSATPTFLRVALVSPCFGASSLASSTVAKFCYPSDPAAEVTGRPTLAHTSGGATRTALEDNMHMVRGGARNSPRDLLSAVARRRHDRHAQPANEPRVFGTANASQIIALPVQARVPLREMTGRDSVSWLQRFCPSELIIRIDGRHPLFATHGPGRMHAERVRPPHGSQRQKPCVGEQIRHMALQLRWPYVVRQHVEHIPYRASHEPRQILMLSALNGEAVGLPFPTSPRRLELERENPRAL